MLSINIDKVNKNGVVNISKGRITFTMDEDLIEDFKIIAIKLKKSSSNLAEECVKKCVNEHKELL